MSNEFRAELEKVLETREQESIGYCFISLNNEDCYYNLLWTLNSTSLAAFKKHFGRVYTQEEYEEISTIVKDRINKFLVNFPRFKVGSF